MRRRIGTSLVSHSREVSFVPPWKPVRSKTISEDVVRQERHSSKTCDGQDNSNKTLGLPRPSHWSGARSGEDCSLSQWARTADKLLIIPGRKGFGGTDLRFDGCLIHRLPTDEHSPSDNTFLLALFSVRGKYIRSNLIFSSVSEVNVITVRSFSTKLRSIINLGSFFYRPNWA